MFCIVQIQVRLCSCIQRVARRQHRALPVRLQHLFPWSRLCGHPPYCLLSHTVHVCVCESESRYRPLHHRWGACFCPRKVTNDVTHSHKVQNQSRNMHIHRKIPFESRFRCFERQYATRSGENCLPGHHAMYVKGSYYKMKQNTEWLTRKYRKVQCALQVATHSLKNHIRMKFSHQPQGFFFSESV